MIEEYCIRPGHQDFCGFINSSTDVERAKWTCNIALRNIDRGWVNKIRGSRYFWLERTADSTVEETLRKMERHFQW